LTTIKGGTVSGTFNSTPVIFGTLKGTLSYDATDVFLTFAFPTLTPLLPPNAPTNVVNTANGIDNFVNGGGTLPAAFQNLTNLSPSQLVNALTQLDGEAATEAEKGAFTLMTQFLGLLLDPSVDGRTGASNFAPEQQASFPPDVALAYAALVKAPPKPKFEQRWTVWGAGFGGSNTTNGNATIGSNNVTASDFGFAVGADYHYSPDTLLGFALAGAGTNWGLAQNLGGGRSDAFMVGGYGITHFGPAYLAADAAFANHWFSTSRTALGDQLTARFNGQSYGARLEAGYRYAMPVNGAIVGVTPYAAVQGQWFHTAAYNETDNTGGGFGLSFGAMNAHDTRSELGGRFDELIILGGHAGTIAGAHRLGPRLGQQSGARRGVSGTARRRLHRQWRDAAETLRAHHRRRTVLPDAAAVVPRQVRGRICLQFANLRWHRDAALCLVVRQTSICHLVTLRRPRIARPSKGDDPGRSSFAARFAYASG
jgi:outer membrane autotransporter protein